LILAEFFFTLAALLSLGWFAANSLETQREITQNLYVHPFLVSNTAADLKGSLFQLRNEMLQIVMIRDESDDFKHMYLQTVVFSDSIRADLEIIKKNFLGDMNQVMKLEMKLNEWDVIRVRILAAAQKGDMKAAEHLERTVGTRKFEEIVPLVQYVIEYARNMGKRFVNKAESHSEQIIFDMRWVVFLISCFLLVSSAVMFLMVMKLQNELTNRATTDALTCVPNRRHFMELAELEFNRGLRYGGSFVLALADLDHFKAINDTHGHQAGDLVLKAFCNITTTTILRSSDILGRIGGEEFAILLPNIELSEARDVVDRVKKAVEASFVLAEGDLKIKFTASFGLTTFNTTDTKIGDMFRRADKALYEAKKSGRNRICIQC